MYTIVFINQAAITWPRKGAREKLFLQIRMMYNRKQNLLVDLCVTPESNSLLQLQSVQQELENTRVLMQKF